MIDDLLRALPLRDVNVRAGSAGNCGGMMFAFMDVEAAPAYEFVNATPRPGGTYRGDDAGRVAQHLDDPELTEFCVTYVREGIETALTELFSELPPIRVTLNRVGPHQSDSAEWNNRLAGQYAAYELMRRAGLGEVVPSPAGNLKLIPPLPS